MKISHLNLLYKKIQAEHGYFKGNMQARGKWTRRNELLQMMYTIYEDIILVNERLITVQTEYRALEARQKHGSTSDAEIKRQFKLYRFFELDIKTLYNLVYAVDHCLSRSFVVGKVDLQELKRILLFRHLYLFHYPPIDSRQKPPRPLRSFNRTFAADIETYEIFHLPPQRTAIYFSGIVRLKQNAKKYIPELNGVKNDAYPDIIRLLYRNLDKLNDRKLRRATMKFLKEKGIVSDTPVHILETLYVVLRLFLNVMKVK